MIYRVFRAEENEDMGSLGWLMEGAPSSFDPLGGMAVAHDMLEEFPHETGTIESELQATGAILWLRGETGYLNRTNPHIDIAQHMSADHIRLVCGEEITEHIGRRTMPLDETTEDLIDQVITTVARGVREEGVDEEALPSFLLHAKAWIRTGYRRARRRFRDIDQHELAYGVFNFIEETADRLLAAAEQPGAEMSVTISPTNYAVKVRFWAWGKPDYYDDEPSPPEVFTYGGWFTQEP